MGCINSKKKHNELKVENVFRVRVVRLQPESTVARSGYLELNPRELIFVGHGREPVVWALQHLRRYGLNGDVFSFEAGRRCMTGPGIYTFRCQQPERLYYPFQRYVNAVSLAPDEAFGFADRTGEHPAHTLGRPDSNPHANHYLEPAPMAGAALRSALAPPESFSSSPLSLDSPDSVPSLSFTNEVVHFQSQTQAARPYAYASAKPKGAPNNVYLEQPFRTHPENNNNSNHNGNTTCTSHSNNNNTNKANHSGGCGGGGAALASGGESAFQSLPRQLDLKRSSLDVPPDECAPMLHAGVAGGGGGGTNDALHMYANVDPSERCYENLSRLDLAFLLQPAPQKEPGKPHDHQAPQHPPSQSTAAASQQASHGGVNYIVLDLDQPRSPAQCSPKTCFGSGLSLTTDVETPFGSVLPGGGGAGASALGPLAGGVAGSVGGATKPDDGGCGGGGGATESSLGYSTIDFIKTCALIKSSTHADFESDFDPDVEEEEESRITRHSKCPRKAYSISE